MIYSHNLMRLITRTMTLIAFVIIVIMLIDLTSPDLESTLNAWYGFQGGKASVLKPVTFFGIPVYAPFIALGVKLPLLSGIVNSPLAWVAPYLSIFSLQIVLVALSLASALIFTYYVLCKVNNYFRGIYFLLLDIVVVSTTWFYVFVNDWSEIALGYLGAIHLFLFLILISGNTSVTKRTKAEEIVMLIIAGIGSLLISLTHVGYMPALVYPLLFFTALVLPTSSFLRLNAGSKIILSAFAILLVLKQLQLFDELTAINSSNLRKNSPSELFYSIFQGTLSILRKDSVSREIILPVGLNIAVLCFIKIHARGELLSISPSLKVAKKLNLVSIFSVLFIFVNNLGVIPSASQNWLYRDIAVWSGLFSWLLIHKSWSWNCSLRIRRFMVVCVFANMLTIAIFFTTLILGSAEKAITTPPEQSRDLIVESIDSTSGGRLIFDFEKWSPFFSEPGKKLDPRSIYSKGISTITGWPKMRGSMPIVNSIPTLEGRIDQISCNPLVLEFLQVGWIATDEPCEIVNGVAMQDGIKLYKNDNFIIVKGIAPDFTYPNCELLDANCMTIYLENGLKQSSSQPQVLACKVDCAFELNFPVVPGETYLLPIKYDSGLYLKDENEISDLKISKSGSLMSISNKGKNSIVNTKIYYAPSYLQVVSIVSSILMFLIVTILSLLFVMRFTLQKMRLNVVHDFFG